MVLFICNGSFSSFGQKGNESRYQQEQAAGIWALDFDDILYEKSGNLKTAQQLTKVFEADNPYIVGLAPRFSLEKLNPEKHKYEFEAIDRVIDLGRVNKKLKLIRVVGHKTPEWLFKEGAQYIEFLMRNKREKERL